MIRKLSVKYDEVNTDVEHVAPRWSTENPDVRHVYLLIGGVLAILVTVFIISTCKIWLDRLVPTPLHARIVKYKHQERQEHSFRYSACATADSWV